ncbi:MAG TPA: phosphoribosylamine--glycine ligase [Candidatus Saccharimonadales bacterium]|nr:phosphoribosylamine--glycine ligase [Candidatus Saccharimonadales bacterium]
MKILVIGSGGREHALCWKLSQSPRVKKIFCAPGNAGTAEIAENVDIPVKDIERLADFAQELKIDLTVVGPDGPMADGVVNLFERRGLRIFGPTAEAARIESSKVFAKEVMGAAGVPTARYEVVEETAQAASLAKKFGKAAVKADGLALGKGVILCQSAEEIVEAVNTLGDPSLFGDAGRKIVIEELLDGEEASILAFCDGKTARLMLPSQDHKRILDGNKGGNTGGMGAYAPTPVVSGLEKEIHDSVFVPVLKELAKRGSPFKGVLYAGLMVKDGRVKVLEFNARFGDPEAQPLLSLLDSDLVDIAEACMAGRLNGAEIKWKDGASCCVVISSKGYPGKYETGKRIDGLDEANRLKGVMVFHAGTKNSGGKILTNGGRVLGVTGTGKTIGEAVEKAYLGVSCINFEGMHYRKDIARSALVSG